MEFPASWLEQKYPFVGLVESPRDHSTDNGLLFTATAEALGFDVRTDRLAVECANPNWTLNRYPGDTTELESWDDYIGVASQSPSLAALLLKAGGFWSYWDNVGGGFKWASWFGRFPGFVPFLKIASGGSLGPIGVVELALSFLMVLSATPEDTSGKALDYIRLNRVCGRYWLVDQAIKVWWWKVRKDNGSMSGVYSIYFGLNHPITIRARELGI